MKLPASISWLTVAVLLLSPRSHAQCSNWGITATIVTSSTCAANGAFNVTLTGPDAANLTNIQYGIPIAGNGFSVPLNSSPFFTGIPGGTYAVSAVANCGGTIVGRNTTITIPGSYTPPGLQASGQNSLSCASTGSIYYNVTNGVAPFTYNIIAHPSAYTGPLTFSSANNTFLKASVPPGSYTVQVVDACGSGTAPAAITVGTLNPSFAPYIAQSLSSKGCDTLIVAAPEINSNSTAWGNYAYDTSFKVSIQISGGISGPTPYLRMPDTFFTIKLPLGLTLKDCYGKTITYTIHPPCGPNITLTQLIPSPSASASISQNCNANFTAVIGAVLVCKPVTFTIIHNNGSGANYGPFISATGSFTTVPLSLGSYSISFTTADGYTGGGSMNVAPVTGNPYSVSIINGAEGLNNYIEGFAFTTTAINPGTRTVQLFNGPVGYSANAQWYSNNTQPFTITQNQTPTLSTVKFPAGTYVWKITDNCGSYYLPVTVAAQDLYQFTVGTPTQQQTCAGLTITPSGTATSAGASKPVSFSVLLNGNPLYVPCGTGWCWPVYPLGMPILLTAPGVYTIVPTAAPAATFVGGYNYYGGFTIGYPNIYTSSYTFTYTLQPLGVDINRTQGFLCKGGSPGQGQIFAKGKNGVPIGSGALQHYNYYLAQQGQGVSGPYITNNTSGIFSNFGANANSIYDLKVVDSCGAFAIQAVKILDLGTARLISSTQYVACEFGDVQLSAIYLPNATYSWTGPAGFTSTLREPLLTNVGPQNIGVYHVTVTTTECSQSITDSTTLTTNPNPPKPVVSYSCMPRPFRLMVTNPSPGYSYQWDVGYYYTNPYPHYDHYGLEPSDTAPNVKIVYVRGSYNAVAVDTITGCTTYSDTLFFKTNLYTPLHATIYSPHFQICTGDTTILVAQGQGVGGAASFQWFLNSVAISGATSATYSTSFAGNYRVRIQTGPCDIDTSAIATITTISLPSAIITTPAQIICSGDTATLQANTGAGFSYTWHLNGVTIPGAFSSVYGATQSGSYYVTISNGGCVASSAPLTITVNPAPVVNINPATAQSICAGGTVHFSTTASAGYNYQWQYNSANIPGATSNTYDAALAGTYAVVVSTASCAHVTSQPVVVNVLPAVVELGNDITMCSLGTFAIPFSASSGFSQVLWSNGQSANSITATAPGLYWVRATNACGTFSDTIRIHTIGEYFPALPDDTLICNAAGSAQLNVPATLQNVLWSTGATTASISINGPGLYTVQGVSPCGLLYDTIRVAFCAPHILNLTFKDSICEGDCIQLSAATSNFPHHYSWSLPGGQPDTSVSIAPGAVCYAHSGVYPVTLYISSAGGRDSMMQEIVVASKPQPRFKDTAVVLSYKTSVTLPACATAQKVDWYKGDSLVCSGCNSITIEGKYFRELYRCVVRNGDCTDSCTYSLRVIDIPHDLWLPDAFTPNGDGRNDIFRIITDNPNVLVIGLAVYNRWGERVFISNMNNGGWDGQYHGLPAESGTYFYHLRYKVLGMGEEIYERRGDVLLVR